MSEGHVGDSRPLLDLLRLIRVEHTLFALPYVYIGMIISPDVGGITPLLLLQVTLCAVLARTSAMLLNRLIDEPIDARNRRTRYRLPLIQSVGRTRLLMLAGASMVLLVLVAYTIDPILAYLAPVAAGMFLAYPYMKRFTSASHFLLGLTLSIAPVGGFLSVQTEGYAWSDALAMVLYAAAVTAWVAGFDIIYSLGDLEFDRRAHLHSVPVLVGHGRAVAFAGILYTLSVVLLYGVSLFSPAPGPAYLLACILVAVSLAYQIRLAWHGHWKKAFDMNLIVSPMIMASLLIDVMFPH